MHVTDDRVYSGSRDHTVREWKISDASTVRNYTGHESSVYRLRRHENVLYTCSWDGKLILWDIESGNVLRSYEHGEKIMCFTMHEDIVYTGDIKGVIRAFTKSKKVALYENNAHTDALTQLIIKNNNLYSSSVDGKIKEWDLLSIEEKSPGRKSHWNKVKFYVMQFGSRTHISNIEPKPAEQPLRPRTKSAIDDKISLITAPSLVAPSVLDDKKRSNSVGHQTDG